MTVSQYFVYRRPVAWTLLVATLAWGVYAYKSMPQRQDPVIQVRMGIVQTAYPGADAVEVEQEVTRKIEKRLAENPAVEHVRSISREGLSVVFVDLFDTTKNAEAVWQDLDNKLSAMKDLPTSGGMPLRPTLDKDFGDTVAVLLTLTSPPVPDREVESRAETLRKVLAVARDARPEPLRSRRFSTAIVHPKEVDARLIDRLGSSLLQDLSAAGLAEDGRTWTALSAGGIDFRLPEGRNESDLRKAVGDWETKTLALGLGHPDVWPQVLAGDLETLAAGMKRRVQAEPGGVARYSYEELHRFADQLQDRLRQAPRVGKIEQIGVVDEALYLYYSNRKMSPYGQDPASLARRLEQRNMNQSGGMVELPRQNLAVKASGKLTGDGDDLGSMVVDVREGRPMYLRDLVEIVRGSDDPPTLLNFRTHKYAPGSSPTKDEPAHAPFWQPKTQHGGESHAAPDPAAQEHPAGEGGPPTLWTSRAVTLAVRHIKGTQIARFSEDVDAALVSMKGVLPDDLRIERTSDEPQRVSHKIEHFNDSFLEAVVIVVVVALLFMEWRSALIVSLSIPVTLAMTLGVCQLLGVDLQQISIAALIIALGLLVDDPVVAGDAINREIAHGVPRDVAAWLGPQKLSRAILYATVTNCVAFLPLLLIPGIVGEFIWSLPVVVTASLVCSRIVSMTFVPLLGYYLLRGQKGMEAGVEGGRGSRFARWYNGFSEMCMEYKWASLAICVAALAAGGSLIPLVGTAFFPKDLHTLFTVDVHLPEGSSIRESKAEALRTIAVIDQMSGDEVESYTTFVGAGGPRFWLSSTPEPPTSNYAQILVHTRDPYDTVRLAERLKRELPPKIAAARVGVLQLESGPPVGIPVQIRLMGTKAADLRMLSDQLQGFMRDFPGTENIHDDWGPEHLQIRLHVDPDKAEVAGVTHRDVANLTSGSLSGTTTTSIRERDRLIPVVLRLRPDERGRLADLRTLSVVGSQSGARVPLDQIAAFRPEFVAPKICRRDHEECVTVKCDVLPGVLPSRVVEYLEAKLAAASKEWPPGTHYAIGGEKEEQEKGFASMSIAMMVSIASIYVALVLQFNSLTKPLVVFAAVPFGMVGGMMGLLIFNVPLGFFALLGQSSLAGVIISHVIVLFEYIEEAHERGEPLRRAVIDAALVRLRPVLVTVLATIGGLIPLALKGGPLWEPLCYVQIMGLLVATLVTKIVVPVLYVIFVEDLGWIRWSAPGEHVEEGPPAEYRDAAAHGRIDPAHDAVSGSHSGVMLAPQGV